MSQAEASWPELQGEGLAFAPITLTPSQIAGYLLERSWYLLPSQFTFSIPTAGSQWPGYGSNPEPTDPHYATLNADQAFAFAIALALWDRLIAPNFTKTDDLTNPGVVRVAFTTESTTSSGHAVILSSSTPNITPRAGDIWLNVNMIGSKFPLFAFNFYAVLHEIGHVLGLKHSFDAPALPTAYDNIRYTVMSYTEQKDLYVTGLAPGSNGVLQPYYYDINPGTPMVLDIAAVQSRYGADLTTNTGDDNYDFDSVDEKYGILLTLYDAGGTDTIDVSALKRGSIIDLTPGSYSSIAYYSLEQQIADTIAQYPGTSQAYIRNVFGDGDVYIWKDNLGIAFTTTIENVLGSVAADTITGNSANNVFTGGGGNDVMDGGVGTDTARYSGASTNYSWTAVADGSWTVKDLRTGSPDGTDTLLRMEALQFTDRTVQLGTLQIPAALVTAFLNILRLSAPGGTALTLELDLAAKLGLGQLTQAQAVTQIVSQAGASTSVATLAYEFFTGKIPSAAGMDFLVSPTGPNGNNLNSAYYQSFNLENRYINFAVNLGKLGEGKIQFEAAYGIKTLFDATKSAYTTIFGLAPTDAKVHLLIDSRVDYFAAYGGDGATGIGTKAAMVGWLLAEAVKADTGMYARANDAFLIDLADGANFAVDLVGLYGKPEFNI